MQTQRFRKAIASALCSAVLAAGCLTPAGSVDIVETGLVPVGAVHAEDLLVVDCLLPGQVRKLGRSQVFMTPKRPVKTSSSDCEIRGGEYVAYDRADYRTALRVWLDKAEAGDAVAQNYVGEIYDKGMGSAPDPVKAAQWYRRAADQGLERAMTNLGQLYELGRGVPRDDGQALAWYRKASGLAKSGVEYQVAVEITDRDRARQQNEVLLAAAAPPSIQLIEPPIPETRGLGVVYAASTSSASSGEGADRAPRSAPDALGATRTVIGRVVAPSGLMALFVNDTEHTVDDRGLFRVAVPIPTQAEAARGAGQVVIAAVDRKGQRVERRLRVSPKTPARKSARRVLAREDVRTTQRVDFGNYHALVIGNGAYQNLPRLETARADAEAVADVLGRRYGFEVTLLLEATRYDILSALNQLRSELTENDNLLIYYAGHGELDKVNMRGQWLPVDAERKSSANWISNVSITDILNAMNTRHVMVVSDSCYSGALTRSTLASLDAGLSEEKRAAWFEALASKRSRTALTSGGLAPVLDSGGGGHSVFARAFLDVLRQNAGLLEGQRLYQELSARVTFAARNYQFEQMPQYAPIKFAGHEAGDFFFVPRS